MEADTRRMRGGRPYVFADLLRRKGLDRIVDFIVEAGALGAAEPERPLQAR